MHITHTKRDTILLVGITARTCNAAEMDPLKAQIGATVQRYFQENWPNRLVNRPNPGTTYSAYTHYESDLTGDYTYFIGEEVSSFDDIPKGATTLTIPAQDYAVFTNGPGPMPDVCIQIWQHIWNLDSKALGGDRRYLADFEIYDERAQDHANTTLDIFIGIQR